MYVSQSCRNRARSRGYKSQEHTHREICHTPSCARVCVGRFYRRWPDGQESALKARNWTRLGVPAPRIFARKPSCCSRHSGVVSGSSGAVGRREASTPGGLPFRTSDRSPAVDVLRTPCRVDPHIAPEGSIRRATATEDRPLGAKVCARHCLRRWRGGGPAPGSRSSGGLRGGAGKRPRSPERWVARKSGAGDGLTHSSDFDENLCSRRSRTSWPGTGPAHPQGRWAMAEPDFVARDGSSTTWAGSDRHRESRLRHAEQSRLHRFSHRSELCDADAGVQIFGRPHLRLRCYLRAEPFRWFRSVFGPRIAWSL